MKFDVIICHKNYRTFEKVTGPNGQPCINGTPQGVTANVIISVMSQSGEQAETFPSSKPDNVLYSVNVGDCIGVSKKMNGTLRVHYYRVTSVTDKEVIGGPIE